MKNLTRLQKLKIAESMADFIHDQAQFATEIQMGYFDALSEEAQNDVDINIDHVIDRIYESSERLFILLKALCIEEQEQTKKGGKE